MLIHKLRWTHETLCGEGLAGSAGVDVSRGRRDGRGSECLLHLDTSGWDGALREEVLALLADNLPR